MNPRTRFLAMSRSNHLEYREVPFRLTRRAERTEAPLDWRTSLEEWCYGLSLGFLLVLFTVALFSLGGCARKALDLDVPPDGWCDSHHCQVEAVTYTAAGEGIGEILDRDLARWTRATGRTDLGTSPDSGIPVIWRSSLVDVNGNTECARTRADAIRSDGALGRWWIQSIELDPVPPPGCPSPEVSLMHELIHAMNPDAVHLSIDSLFAAGTGPGPRSIDEPALEALCSGFDCWRFEPESR